MSERGETMGDLIKELRAGHADIFDLLLRVKALGVHTPEGQKTFIAARASLIEHLRQEDEELYPVLLKKAERDALLKEKL